MRILGSQPNVIANAVEIAMKRQAQLEAEALARKQASELQASKGELYQYSCQRLLQEFDRVVEQFNEGYQSGKIKAYGNAFSGRHYSLPTGGQIDFSFFPRRDSGIPLAGGQLIGGGYVEISRSASGNLLLVRDGDDDLYGRWLGCLLTVRVGVDPKKIIGSYGITSSTVQPFGLKREEDFYEHIPLADGHVMHIFNYDLRTDMKQLFVDLLETALQKATQSK